MEKLIDDKYWEEDFADEFNKIQSMTDEEFEEYLKKNEKNND